MKYTWFFAVGYDGEWIIENGKATVIVDDSSNLTAELSESSGSYMKISGTLNDEGLIQPAKIERYSSLLQETDILEYHGIYDAHVTHNKKQETYLFSDGRSVIGIAGGEDNAPQTSFLGYLAALKE